MNRLPLEKYFEKRNLPASDLKSAEDLFLRLEEFLEERGVGFTAETMEASFLETFLSRLLEEEGEISVPVFLALMRGFVAYGRIDLYIFLTRYTGPDGVIRNILDRAEKVLGPSAPRNLEGTVRLPPLGTAPRDYPAFTSRFMAGLKSVCPSGSLGTVMAGNNHGIPESAFADEKAEYAAAPTLEAYLSGRHARQVAILRRHCEEKKVWFEQEITPGVLELVENNPEIQSAVLKSGKLYATKIPYDGKSLLEEKDPVLRRYHACHCPFVREAVREGRTDIDPDWCLCSAGYEKHLFECLFGRPVPIRVLNSVLLGDEYCRFEMDLEGIPYKK